MEEKEKRDVPGFMQETIKQRPVNKKKLFRKTVITICLAIIFGTVASITILVFEPVFNQWLYPEDEPNIVTFPEDDEEIKPEDMIPTEEIIKHDELLGLEDDELEKLLENYNLDKENYQQLYASLNEYIKEISKSMVTVTGVTSDVDWFQNSYETKGRNYGVIIADNGRELLILTCIDSLNLASEIQIIFNNGSEANGVIKQIAEKIDLAIVAVDKDEMSDKILESIAIASLGSSTIDAKVGTPVVALGSPLGTVGSIGYGMIASTLQGVGIVDGNFQLYTTDIYGSSNAKGVVFNLDSEIIGIIGISQGSTDVRNLISAIGISELKTHISLLSNNKFIPYLGVYGINVTLSAYEEQGVPYGAYITQIEMNSPAMRGGIQKGDVITKIDDENIYSYNELVRELLKKEPETEISIVLKRQVQNEYKEVIAKIVLQ